MIDFTGKASTSEMRSKKKYISYNRSLIVLSGIVSLYGFTYCAKNIAS